MHLTHHHNTSAHTLTFHIDAHPSNEQTHHTTKTQFTLHHKSFRFLLPDTLTNFDAVHPDLWALVAVLVVYPFVHKELRLSFAVSQTFADAFHQASNGTKRVFPIDNDLQARQAPDVAHASVAFSGRVHASLTAAIVGKGAKLVAVDHWNAMLGERTSPYPADALYYALDTMETHGYHVSLVKTDVASLCAPYGFAHPLAACVGNVLLADALQLDTVHVGCRLADVRAFGEVTRTTRGKGSNARTDTRVGAPRQTLRAVSFRNDDLWLDTTSDTSTVRPVVQTLAFWKTLFGAVQLRLGFPLCGASDTCIVKLLHNKRAWDTAHYCLYSRPKHKCGACIECVYYQTLHDTVNSKAARKKSFDEVWTQCTDQFPEATTCVHDMHTPNRWHLFWAALVERRDAMPDGKAFDVLHAYHRAIAPHAHGLHAGMQEVVRGQDEVMRGWRRMYGGE